MTNAAAELLEACKALSVADRLALADAIWETIPIDDDWRPSASALAEVHRRLEEHDRDPGSAVSWEEMQLRLKRLRMQPQ